ncbi:Putative uncharacterized protein [Pararhodospirillum photometricum DSM 122]|uniref:Uncharacterized protein n=1 Tax=Pararhodospirillum photometricum DSM 122 TaxID=1150469 RepID=H6SPC7_PARPM|nr:Putative uncharacterized protein [Pararhodospirillum photometricum DSM 122]
MDFQIRTFWYGLLIMVIGGALSLVLIGYAVLLFWLVWLIVRCVKGLLLLNENRPIANPTSFMFG